MRSFLFSQNISWVAVLTVFGWFCAAEMAAQVQRRPDFWQQHHDDALSDFNQLCVRLFA
jgi:hypothetical protein